jgi:6-phosphogluconolactonase (cycloisomerase 2 family)
LPCTAVTVFAVDPEAAGLKPEGAPYPNDQSAMCWTAFSPDGKTLYTANFVSNSVSAYSVAVDGKLALLGNAPKRLATRPDSKDLQVSPDGKYLYLVGPVATQVAVFAIGADRLPQELPEGRSPFLPD